MTISKWIVGTLFIPVQVFAWGAVGHRTVGLIAEANLTPQAKLGVQQLLGAQTLSGVANWADSLRSTTTYKPTVWYHFEKIPDGVSFIDNLKALPDWQQKKGGIVAAILVANEILRDNSSSGSAKTDALKFLVHFVGDIHQPLHTGRPVDNGAVKIDTTWFGKPMSVHAIWDSGMIMSGHSTVVSDGQSIENNANAYANFLLKAPPLQLTPTMDVEEWLNESLALRTAAYDKTYETNPSQYQTQHLPEVDQRIYQAGVRLAKMLNDIYGGQQTPPLENTLKGQIESVVGDIHQLINFNP